MRLEGKKMGWKVRMVKGWRYREEPNFGEDLYVHGKEFVLHLLCMRP